MSSVDPQNPITRQNRHVMTGIPHFFGCCESSNGVVKEFQSIWKYIPSDN